MTDTQPTAASQDATCPLPNCTSPLLLVRHFAISITDDPGANVDTSQAFVDDWELVCEGGGHTLGQGGTEHDGIVARIGYRIGQSLGGVR